MLNYRINYSVSVNYKILFLQYCIVAGNSRAANKSSPMPRRSPPSPPSAFDSTRDSSQGSVTSKAGGGGAQLGAFWSTQHAKDSLTSETKREPKFDEEPTSHSMSKHDRIHPDNHPLPKSNGTEKDEHTQTHPGRRNLPANSVKASKIESTATFQDEAFNTFVAEFDTQRLESGIANDNIRKEEALEPELEKLKEQLKQANLEKAEISSKFEKLSAICRSQRQEIQELKQALAARTPSPNKDPSRSQISPGVQSSTTPPVLFSTVICSYALTYCPFSLFLYPFARIPLSVSVLMSII